MTREQAIEIIRKEYLCVDRDCDIDRSCGKCDLMMPAKEPILQAYKMAIKALSQEPICDRDCEHCTWTECPIEPCTDAVSRDDVMQILYDYDCTNENALMVKAIKALPSVNAIQHTTNASKDVEQRTNTLGDAVSREDAIIQISWDFPNLELPKIKESLDKLPSVTQKSGKWIPCSERLPEAFSFVNCTCHSLIDDRGDWVVETCYLPQLPDSPYSDWGNIPMLNMGDCEVVAWMYRDIPKPYKVEPQAESEKA